MTPLRGLKLVVAAFSLAAVQAQLIDRLSSPIFAHLDLPLAAVIALVLARPSEAAITGFVFGLAVDAFQLQLFGLHALAFCALGPVAGALPVSALRSRTEIVASSAAVQSQVATVIVIGGAWLLDGRLLPGLFGRFVQVGLWSVAIVVPLTVAFGGRLGPSIAESMEREPAATSADWL